MKLTFRLFRKDRVEHLAFRLTSFCYSLQVISRCVCIEATLSAYNVFVNSRLMYNVFFWGNSVDMVCTFKLQKSSMRTILDLKNKDSYKSYFINDNLLTLSCLYIPESAHLISFIIPSVIPHMMMMLKLRPPGI